MRGSWVALRWLYDTFTWLLNYVSWSFSSQYFLVRVGQERDPVRDLEGNAKQHPLLFIIRRRWRSNRYYVSSHMLALLCWLTSWAGDSSSPEAVIPSPTVQLNTGLGRCRSLPSFLQDTNIMEFGGGERRAQLVPTYLLCGATGPCSPPFCQLPFCQLPFLPASSSCFRVQHHIKRQKTESFHSSPTVTHTFL